ncbi:glycosyltransferase family 2 protein [Ammoniphilus sp. CFH 90114]|uniref:glycosyltransferase family 2 protein n=1 Tax=Ammoniphilus sp. CFH 90114 TaxID=2493665 RepID=UPI00100FA993|nr:glycosyltransferase family 2 protein [Ammoniphilus sp. CFH 90114]RXT04466.1 glycosyltransferase family 2 protein [Ammoniphilus sp. CFH 90114]
MISPLVTIVMLSWNRKDDVRESLTRIRDIEYQNLEIIVVDNGSTDGTLEMIEVDFPKVRLLKMFKNIGIEAYNIGFENAKGEYLVIIDDDSFPEKHAISRMVERFEKDPELGVVAFDVRNYYNYDEIKNEQEIAAPAASSSYLMSFNGAGAGVRKQVFKRVGYYPEEFFLYNNELDSAFRILDSGYKIEFFSDIIAYHKFSPTNRASWRAPFYYTRNAFWLIWKNYPLDMAVKQTLNLIYDCFYYSMEQKTMVYIKAMCSAFFHADKLKEKRKPVSRHIAENLRVPFNLSFTFFR